MQVISLSNCHELGLLLGLPPLYICKLSGLSSLLLLPRILLDLHGPFNSCLIRTIPLEIS